MGLETFSIKAEAQRRDGVKVLWQGKIKAADHYAAGDQAKAILAAQGAEYYPILRFGSRRAKSISPELALTLSTHHAEESR